jgi:hypothetical protein
MTNKTFYCSETDHTFDVVFEGNKLEIMRVAGGCELETLPISTRVLKEIAKRLEIEELISRLNAIKNDLDAQDLVKCSDLIEWLAKDKLSEHDFALIDCLVAELETKED